MISHNGLNKCLCKESHFQKYRLSLLTQTEKKCLTGKANSVSKNRTKTNQTNKT